MSFCSYACWFCYACFLGVAILVYFKIRGCNVFDLTAFKYSVVAGRLRFLLVEYCFCNVTTLHYPSQLLLTHYLFHSVVDSDGSSDDVEISFHNGASNHEKLRRGRRNLRAQNGLEISYRNGHKELAGLFKAPLDGKRYRLRQQPLSSLTQKLQVEPLENISAPQTENHSTNLIVLPQKDDPKSGGVMARSNGAATKKNRTLLSVVTFAITMQYHFRPFILIAHATAHNIQKNSVTGE